MLRGRINICYKYKLSLSEKEDLHGFMYAIYISKLYNTAKGRFYIYKYRRRGTLVHVYISFKKKKEKSIESANNLVMS